MMETLVAMTVKLRAAIIAATLRETVLTTPVEWTRKVSCKMIRADVAEKKTA